MVDLASNRTDTGKLKLVDTLRLGLHTVLGFGLRYTGKAQGVREGCIGMGKGWGVG